MWGCFLFSYIWLYLQLSGIISLMVHFCSSSANKLQQYTQLFNKSDWTHIPAYHCLLFWKAVVRCDPTPEITSQRMELTDWLFFQIFYLSFQNNITMINPGLPSPSTNIWADVYVSPTLQLQFLRWQITLFVNSLQSD